MSDGATSGRLELPAPAKLNLFLHVLGRRRDGYHELQTVFQLLDFADRIILAGRRDGQIRRISGAAGVAADEDLAVRAARLLQTVRGTGAGCDIVVDKRIPRGPASAAAAPTPPRCCRGSTACGDWA